MKNDILPVLKMRYNKCLKRNRAAEEYFKTHTVEECLGTFKNKYGEEIVILDWFNKLVNELSLLIIQIEVAMEQHMTEYEKLNGFKL